MRVSQDKSRKNEIYESQEEEEKKKKITGQQQ
jgi:hypothetical protein